MTDWVEIPWPARFKAKAAEYLALAGLEARPTGSDHFRITTSAEYHKRPERLLSVIASGPVAGLASHDVVDAIERLPASVADDGTFMEQPVRDEVHRLLGRDTPAWNNYLEAAQLLATCLPRDEFAKFVEEGLLPTCRASLAGSTISVIEFSHAIHTRTAVVRALFVDAHAPEWADPATGRGFESMRGLAGGALQGQSTWIDPLFAALFPWMFGMGVARGGTGLLAIGFGEALGYRDNLLDSQFDALLRADLLQGDISLKAPPTPPVTGDTTIRAVDWWVNAMSQLFSVVLDPVNHADTSGNYVPRTHFALLVSFERLIASVIKTLLGTGRDEYSRRVHLFEVLDLLEGLGLGGYDQTLLAPTLRRDLQIVRERIPADVAELLLPRCEAAIDGIERVADGFLPQRRDGDMLNLSNGPVGVDKAVTFVIRQIRNAGHGLKKALEDEKKREYVSLHDAVIPNSVSDVVFLHLLILLTCPDRLRRRLSRGRRC